MLNPTAFRNVYLLFILMITSVAAAATVGSATPPSTSLSANKTSEVDFSVQGLETGYYTISFNFPRAMFLGADEEYRVVTLPGSSDPDDIPPIWFITRISQTTYSLELKTRTAAPGYVDHYPVFLLHMADRPFDWNITPVQVPDFQRFRWQIGSSIEDQTMNWEISEIYPSPIRLGERGSVFQINQVVL